MDSTHVPGEWLEQICKDSLVTGPSPFVKWNSFVESLK